MDPKLEELVRQIAQQEAAKVYASKGTMFGVADIPTHTHNGIDSVTLDATGLDQFIALPATPDGVASPSVLGSQIMNDTKKASNLLQAGLNNSDAVFVNPFPIVYGQGNGLYHVTASGPNYILSGATSATLTSAYPYVTQTNTTTFGNGDTRLVNYTKGSTAITWTPGLSSNSGNANLSVQGSPSAFAGGDAPVGTALIYTNPAGGGVSSDGTTLWVRVNAVPGFESGTFNFTSGVASGATSKTLTSAWPYVTGTYWIFFSSGENRPGTFTNGSATVTFLATTTAANATITVSGTGWYGIEFSQLLPI